MDPFITVLIASVLAWFIDSRTSLLVHIPELALLSQCLVLCGSLNMCTVSVCVVLLAPLHCCPTSVTMSQAEVLWSELEGIVLPQSSAHSTGGVSGSKQWSTRLASVIAQLARGVRKTREKDSGPNGHPMSCSTVRTHTWKPVYICACSCRV